ncbi:MAG: ABC transporter, partial [Methylocella sp.]
MNERAAFTPKSAPPEQTSPRALWQLAPYLLRYKPRIAAALLAVTVAAAATLAVPLAIRRMIDFGFSAESAGLINS